MDPVSDPINLATVAATLADRAHTHATTAIANRQRTNLIWERTQAAIAIGITLAYIVAQVLGRGLTTEGLANSFFLVIGFYFGRTNHARPTGTPVRRDLDEPA